MKLHDCLPAGSIQVQSHLNKK